MAELLRGSSTPNRNLHIFVVESVNRFSKSPSTSRRESWNLSGSESSLLSLESSIDLLLDSVWNHFSEHFDRYTEQRCHSSYYIPRGPPRCPASSRTKWSRFPRYCLKVHAAFILTGLGQLQASSQGFSRFPALCWISYF